jgi:hypothetical protein
LGRESACPESDAAAVVELDNKFAAFQQLLGLLRVRKFDER